MWRTLIVTSGEKMTVRDGWLHVYSPQQEARVPIGDLYSVVVDNRQTLLSMGVLTQLAQAGVHVLLCDEKHLPCAELLPLSQHYRPLTVLQNRWIFRSPLRICFGSASLHQRSKTRQKHFVWWGLTGARRKNWRSWLLL